MRLVLTILLLSVSYPAIQEDIQYIIICSAEMSNAAQSLADMHISEVNADYQLNTEVVLVEGISSDTTGMDIREYVLNRIQGNSDLKYLLLFGDEIDIPPIYYNDDYPSDDFYTTADNTNIFSGDPQLASGRIPVSNENDAWIVVDKIKNYTLNPTPGIWRSKVALVADDIMYRSCSLNNGESSHTVNSDAIYDSLKTLLPILPFYGVDYPLRSGCAHPDLTGDLIRTINNGVAMINYIGHGDPETWAGEKLISKSRDLSLIHPGDNKLAIWIAGTCSFGKYNGENSFMEALLFKEYGAIAMVATTDAVGYTENSNYLKNLFGLTGNHGIKHIVKEGLDIRLGELVLNAKNGHSHKFHTFGDPALRLPFPTISENLVDYPPASITLVEEQTVSVNNPEKHSTLLVRGYDKEFPFGTDSLFYTIPGDTYAQMNSDSSEICFRIPIDAGTCDDCTATIHLYQDDEGFDGKIQYISDIPIVDSNASSNDETGPDIYVSQNGNPIIEGSAIIPGVDLTISLNDSSGINLMETIEHGIRYAFDDDDLILIAGDEFIYENCSDGLVNVPLPPSLSPGMHHFYLEAWDGVNNQSTIEIDICNDNITDNYDCDGNCIATGENLDVNGLDCSEVCGGDDISCLAIEELIMPQEYSLSSIYPNPFNPTTTISFSIPQSGMVSLKVYDITGKLTSTLTDEYMNAGYYNINWNASSYPSGVYLIRMDSGDFTQTQKVVLVK